MPIKVSIWDETLAAVGPALETASKRFSVVVAKRLTAKMFGGISLSSKNSSSFTVDPPIELAEDLKTWFNSLPEAELQNFLCDQSIAISKELVIKGSIDIYTLAELDNVLKSGDYWVKGSLQVSDEEQKLFYVGCNICSTRIDIEDEGVHYRCHVCRKSVVTAFWPLVILSITDHTSTMKAVAMNSIAEMILQSTASNIAKLIKSGI